VPASAAPRYLDGDWVRIPVEGLSRRAVGIGIPRRSPPSAPTRAVIDTLVELVTTSGTHHANIIPTAVTDTS
jgi:DNA-binding transcriptional LysR family regulator